MNSLTGTGTLIRFILRRDRVRLPIWVLGIALSMMGSVASFGDTYPTAADRQARADVLDGAAAQLFVGPGYGTDHYTFGAMTANELLPFAAIVVALMSVFLVVRHTRAEEEGGRAELVRAGVVGRHASTVATLTVVCGAQVLLAVLLTLGLPAGLSELSTSGSFAFAAAVAGVGVVFAGVAVLVAQLTANARTALGISSIVLGATYLVRAIGDMTETHLAWLSPFGWATEMRAYVDARWWPLLLSAALTVGLIAVAIRINARRDIGSGVIADRPGRPAASPLLGSPLGLAFRLQRASLIAWSVSLFLLGLVYGSIADEAASLYEDISALDDYLARIGAADPSDQYLAITISISAVIAVGYAVQSALRARGEEAGRRADPVLAAAVGRSRWVGSHLVMALGGSVVLMFAFGLGLGISRAISAEDIGELPRLIGAALAYTPALWVFVGVAVALFGLVPRAVGVAWAFLGLVAVAGFLGPLLQLPDWVYDLSPVDRVPDLPVADISAGPLIGLTLIAAALVALGLVGFRRRDLTEA
jgi:ABC-2 type transport system permease protein